MVGLVGSGVEGIWPKAAELNDERRKEIMREGSWLVWCFCFVCVFFFLYFSFYICGFIIFLFFVFIFTSLFFEKKKYLHGISNLKQYDR